MNAKLSFPLLTAVLSVACILSGCQYAEGQGSIRGAVLRNRRGTICYSLLHQLLNDQKNVSLLRFHQEGTGGCQNPRQEDCRQLRNWSKALGGICPARSFDHSGRHPTSPGEAATRKAIASTKEKELLGQTGGEFELSLLLTQVEALSYASHLAKSPARTSLNPIAPLRWLA